VQLVLKEMEQCLWDGVQKPQVLVSHILPCPCSVFGCHL
jgi:hypothetical protein